MISVIVPCYNEEDSINTFYTELKKEIYNTEHEILMINDGSTDRTLSIIKDLAEKDSCIRYYSFSRNFGKEAAIYAGLCNAGGEYVVCMDADMQDPPSLLPRMLRILEEDKSIDSVATRRVSREGEPKIRSFCARAFYKLINKISDADVVDGARDYRLMRREMVDAVISLTEYNRFSKGIFGWVGFNTYWLPYENIERVAGETKWSFWKLSRYALDGIISFSEVPLKLASYCGIFFTLVAFLFLVFIVLRKLIFGDPVAGWASQICVTIFIGGIQLLCIGIVGLYLAKTHVEVKKRPHYIVADTNDKNSQKIR